MKAIKAIRIVLAVVCLITIPLTFVIPITSYFNISVGDLVGTHLDDTETVFVNALLIAAALMLATAVLSFIFPVKKKVPGIFGVIAGAIALSAWIICIADYGDYLGAGAFICLLFALAVLVLSIVLLALKEGSIGAGGVNDRGRQGEGGSSGNIVRQMGTDKASIVGVNGAYHNASFDVSDGRPVMFGRDTNTCSVIFDQYENAVSRQHCIVAFLPNSNMYSVRDLSRFGTYVDSMNNRLPANAEFSVPRGTVLYLGSVKNSFRLN